MSESMPAGSQAPARVSWVRRFARFLMMRQAARRSAMFYLLLVALGFVFVGSFLIPDWLRARPMFLFVFWLTCACLTLIAMVLAFFDLLLVRVAGRVAHRTLREKYQIDDKEV